MQPQETYEFEFELSDGTILSNSNPDNASVVRISFIPSIVIFPRHDIIFSGFKYIKRFGRGMMKLSNGQKEYLHCVVTDSFRFYLRCSNGQSIITHKDYELYL